MLSRSRLARSPIGSRLMTYVLPRAIVEASVKNVFGDPAKVTPELVDRYYDLTLRAGNRRAVAKRFAQSSAPSAVDRLPDLHMPTLILWGAKDHLIDPSTAERFKQLIPGSSVVLFTALGHVPQEEDPVTTLRSLRPFLSDSASRQ